MALGGIIAGAQIVGGLMGADAAKSAASQQAAATREALAMQQRQYEQQRQDNEPWRKAGEIALGQLQDGKFQESFDLSKFQADPSYQFQLAEGNKAINAAAAARGMGTSGATLKALARYGQDHANKSYGDAYNRYNNDMQTQFSRLSSMAGIGQSATNQVGQAGMNYANNASGLITGMGNAQAAGSMGQANAIGGALNQGANTWLQLQMMDKQKSPWDLSNGTSTVNMPTMPTGWANS